MTRRTASFPTGQKVCRKCALLGLASSGVCQAESVTRSAGALLPHRFTLTSPGRLPNPRLAVYFLLHCPDSRERWALPTTASSEARTFLNKHPVSRTSHCDHSVHSASTGYSIRSKSERVQVEKEPRLQPIKRPISPREPHLFRLSQIGL